jgi:tetratricopeptide (TPR) repeat protein
MIDTHKMSIFLAFWLGLYVLVTLGFADAFWGIHLLIFFPTWMQILTVVCLSALFIPAVHNGIMQIAEWLCQKIPHWLRLLLLISSALFLFYLFPSTTHFLGDGALLLRELSQTNPDATHQPDRAPLIFFLIGQLKKLGFTAKITYQLYSWTAGVLYVLLAFLSAYRVGRIRAERIVALGLLVTPSFALLFFGYIETYALLLPMSLAYLLAGQYVLQEKRALYLPAILLGILIPLHLIYVLLIPSLLILTQKQIKQGCISLFLTSMIACGLLWVSGLPPWQILKQSGGAAFLTFEADFHRPYSLLSIARVVDVANQYLLVIPAGIGILFLCGRKLRPQNITEIFLVTAALFPVLFTLIANAKIGAFRDWDVMGVATLPFIFWCTYAFVRKGAVKSSGPVLIGIGALHVILWIGVNTTPSKAEARFKMALQTSALSPYAQSYGWETLGGYYRSNNQLDLALEAYKQALKADPKHPRHWNAAGNLYRRMGQPENALQHFLQAVAITPDFAGAYSNLGNALNQLERYEEAISAYEHALSLDANLSEAYTNLGVAHHALGQYKKAVDAHLQALKNKPHFTEALNNLGNTYNAMGNYQAARDVLLQAIQTAPNHAFAQANIGNTYLGLQNYNEALKHLNIALTLQPNLVAAHFNRGLALAELHQWNDAVTAFEEVIRLNPQFVSAYHSLGMVYEQLGQRDQVRTYYQKLLEINPNYPHSALIQKWFQENP